MPDIFGNAGPSINSSENFTCYNRFYGGQVGGHLDYLLGPLQIEVIAKVALGVTNQVVNINGSTVENIPPALASAFGLPSTITSNTALLVQPGNSGHFTHSEMSVLPEGQLNLGYAFNDNLMIKIGYTGMYWTNVVRPENEIERTINIQPLGSPVIIAPSAPIFAFHPTNLWIQGFQAGLEISF